MLKNLVFLRGEVNIFLIPVVKEPDPSKLNHDFFMQKLFLLIIDCIF